MKLAVVVLNWNAAEDTDRCLRSIRGWDLGPGRTAATVWVVDNHSREAGLEAVRRRHPEARVLMSPANRGFAGGSNLGVTAAMEDGCEAVLLLNNDAALESPSVVSMLTTLSSDPRIAIVGPVLHDGDRVLSAGGRDIARHTVTHLRPPTLPERPFDVDYVPGTAALIRASALETTGLLDEDYFFGGEMADLGLRARRHGFRCVTDPDARATHDLGRSSGLRETLHPYYVVRNRFLYVRKHHPERKAWLSLVWGWRAVFASAAALARGRPGRARAIALGLVDGLAGHFGGQNDRVLP